MKINTRGPWTPHNRVQLVCKDKSRTKQSDAKDADINQILKKALRSGQLPDSSKIGRYEDLSSGQDFLDSMLIVQEAKELFQELPSQLRQELDNDPAKFLDWAADESNSQRMIDLGLKEKVRNDGVPENSGESAGSSQGSSSETSNQGSSAGNQEAEGSN